MSLVSIKNFDGSKPAKEALGDMLYCEINTYVMSFGYKINIEPIMPKTPKGLIEDSPNEHEINLIKNVYVPWDSDDDEVISKHSKDDYKIRPLFGYHSVSEDSIVRDVESKSKFFRNTIKIKVNRLKNESNTDYALRMTDVVMRAFGVGL